MDGIGSRPGLLLIRVVGAIAASIVELIATLRRSEWDLVGLA